LAGKTPLLFLNMIERSAYPFVFQGAMTPEKVSEAVLKTRPNITNEGFIHVLRSVVGQTPRTEPKQQEVDPREEQRLADLSAKQARRANNVLLYKKALGMI
jgi:hypothetical protein